MSDKPCSPYCPFRACLACPWKHGNPQPTLDLENENDE